VIKKIVIVGIVILLFTTSILGGCSSKANPGLAGGITAGKAVAALTESVGAAGATLTVSQEDSLIKGMTITVPPNAYPAAREFKISYKTVEKHTFGVNFNPVTPIISIQNGGGYSEDIIDFQIPVNIPEGQFAMAFYYDSKKGTLEGIPTVAETKSSITISTRHFSDIVVSSIAESALGIDAEVDTGFEPRVDDWQFPNHGSYIAAGGHCAGQSITALWYYTQKKTGEGDTSLYGKYDEGTRDLWYDDAAGYRFASVIQKDVDWKAWETRYKKLEPKVNADNSITWKQFIYAMKLTGEPQFVYIRNTAGAGAHAMVVYGASGGALQIADPNYPGENDREIWFEDGQFDPYNSGANTQAILDGQGIAFDQIMYFGTSSLIDFSQVASRWEEFEENTIGNDKFPAYTLQTLNEKGVAVDLVDGFTTKNKNLPIFMKTDTPNLGITVYREGQVLMPGSDATYAISPGNNQLGFYVLGDVSGTGDWRYIDFKYFNVKLDQPTTTAASGGKPVITSFTGPDTLQFDANFNVVGMYTFSVSVEGGVPPYYYIWKGSRMPQVLVEGAEYSSVTIPPQDMRQPGSIADGFFLWVTVRDSKKQHATWGVGSTEFLYGLKFTGKFEVIDGVTTLVENTWQKITEP